MDLVVFQLPWNSVLSGMALAVRTGAFVATAPIAGSESVPAQLRIGFAVLLALLLAPIAPAPGANAAILPLVAGELFAGLLIGFAARMVVDLALFAGELGSHSSGLAIASMLDPVTQQTTPTLGVFYRLLGALAYLAIGGHRQMIGALAKSYEIVPCGTVHLTGPWLPAAVSVTGRMLVLGVRLAAPVLAAAMLVDLFLMLIARAVPQMNILVVGAPLRYLVALLGLAFSLHMLAPIVAEALDGATGDAFGLLRAVAGQR
ncbi:MAG: flagellar biosynthetic protein FliR [Acidobacteria bacterium]|nr:flagellar biosynthetic protein FliR [Acidobacteriota bacterium]